MTRVKICGITNPDDARDAVEVGADAIGLNFYERSPRFVKSSQASRIVEAVPAFVSLIGVFVNHPNPEALEDLALSLGLHAVQLHGNESPDYCSLIQRVKVIKAFRVDSNFKADALKNYSTTMFLLDSGSGAQFGGTGEVFDWNQARGVNTFGWIVLAGGLTPDNVGDAVTQLRPFAVDVSSGVESAPGKKDYEKMRRFIEEVRKTDVALLGES
ncbi:MAG TPA: phosphoribosylanthranilate isomerase [Terriglobia bacterium]|nr:phosphoribosylanthranilate isomerase [Terriglobia bacterium]